MEVIALQHVGRLAIDVFTQHEIPKPTRCNVVQKKVALPNYPLTGLLEQYMSQALKFAMLRILDEPTAPSSTRPNLTEHEHYMSRDSFNSCRTCSPHS